MSDERYEYMELNEELSDKLDKARELIDDLRAEVERLRASQQWQPIETAPVGQTIFCYHKMAGRYPGCQTRIAGTNATVWCNTFTGESGTMPPTHWMPLPEPPAERGEG